MPRILASALLLLLLTKIVLYSYSTPSAEQGEDGKKFKTRSGETVPLVDLLDEVRDLVVQRLSKVSYELWFLLCFPPPPRIYYFYSID